MKNTRIDGQMSFWDIEVPKIIEESTKCPKYRTEKPILRTETHLTDHQQKVIDRYKNSQDLTKIIHFCGGGLGIEIIQNDGYKTIYINKQGQQEFTIENQVPLTPMDLILFYKEEYKEINNIQEAKLQELKEKYNISSYIKRNGDKNIIIQLDNKVIAVNPIGWILEYNKSQCCHQECEVLKFNETDSIEYEIGDTVEAYHGKEKIIGNIFSKYSNQDSFNIVWENKHSAFHVSKIIRKVA